MNNKEEIPKSTDVLVVGAGPTGMTLAISLKQLGAGLRRHRPATRPSERCPGGLRTAAHPGIPASDNVAGPMIADGLKGRGAAFADVDRDLIRLCRTTASTAPIRSC